MVRDRNAEESEHPTNIREHAFGVEPFEVEQ
jgi:hypothetical protein